MEKAEGGNQTSISEFILLGFGNVQDLHLQLFLLFLLLYFMSMTGNLLILVLIMADSRLHTPMYFFLGNLSCLETFYSSTLLPKMLASLLTGDRTISYSGCLVQFFSFGSLLGTECYLLSVMSYDRYLAICNPLRYADLMNDRFCFQLVAGCWTTGLLATLLLLFLIVQLTFCGPNKIDHFFCDYLAVLDLSCSDTYSMKIVASLLGFIFTLPPFLLTMTSYICIISTILRIPSSTGRQKAFSTRSSHLMVVTMFYGTLTIAYTFPRINTLRDLSKALSVFYIVIIPLVNPLIYSLRNREVKEALRNVISRLMT
ncbi:olfactory receptor 6N1-like [Pelodiscus sinensis]|uniref:olfactory receptor 6N1-like n=1 Tax=Pelodiscus sinensis TaxID=13735 RepID=UPI003F6D01A1